MRTPRLLAALVLLAGCPHPAPPPGLSTDEITRLVRPGTDDAKGWAADVRDALVAAGQVPDREHACEVLAIIEQESGYEADPAVPGLPDIVSKAIDDRLASLGPLAGVGREALLDHVAPGETKSFEERLKDVQTEHDVDVLFRDVVAYHEARAPAVAKVANLVFPHLIDRHNPISTAGSMQVSVSWAQAQGREEGLDDEAVRDLLYTRHGGVHYGTARLFAFEADYDKPEYRFADYNAGLYASRNAQLQTEVADLTGLDLAPDGDLLVYNDAGKPTGDDGQTMKALLAWRATSAPDLSESRLRADVRKEKTRDFEDTETWRLVREQWQAKHGKPPPYARVPDVELVSPKFTKELTTRWFAEKVDGRYQKCLARGR